MTTYILRQNPDRPQTQEDERPAKEIADNIRAENRPTTAWGGWSIGTSWKKIQPGDRLLFYRSGGGATGFFAVGRALPADDRECRKLRMGGLKKRFPNNPDIGRFEAVDSGGLAAFRAVSWETGEWEKEKGTGRTEKYYYVNAEWDVVVDNPNQILVPCDIPGRKASGFPAPNDMDVKGVCEKCMKAPNALRAK